MLTLGILSIIQIVFLPGLAAVCNVKHLHLADRILLAVPLSLIINYALVLLLSIAGLYQTSTMLLLVIVEIFLAAAGIRKLSASTKNEKLYQNIEPNGASADNTFKWFVYLLVFAFLLFYNIAAWKAARVAFQDPDVVISWNRWAVSWYQGTIPQIKWGYPVGSYTYPQGVPIFFSETYQFIGDSRVQYFARAVAIIIPYIALITFLRIPHIVSSSPRFRRVILLSVPIFMLVQSTGYRDVSFLFDGCTDPIMAYYGVLLVYLVALLHSRASSANIGASDNFVYIAVTVASTAALIKQPGIIVAALFPALWYYHYGRKVGQAISKLFYSYLIVALLVGHWYVFKGAHIFSGLDSSAYDAYAELMVAWDKRPSTAFEMIFNKIGWPWLVPFLLSMTYPTIRLLMLWGVLPAFLFWASFASYDMRAFFYALPFFSIALSAGCYRIYELSRYRRYYWPLFTVWLIYFAYYLYKNSTGWVKYLGLDTVTTPKLIINIFLLSVLWLFAIKALRKIPSIGMPSFRLTAIVGGLFVVLGALGSSERIERALVNKAIADADGLIGHNVARFLSSHLSSDGGWGYVACREQIFSNVPSFQGRFVFPGCEAPVMYSDPRVRYCLVSDQQEKELDGAQSELRKIGEQDGWKLYEKRSWSQREHPLNN